MLPVFSKQLNFKVCFEHCFSMRLLHVTIFFNQKKLKKRKTAQLSMLACVSSGLKIPRKKEHYYKLTILTYLNLI